MSYYKEDKMNKLSLEEREELLETDLFQDIPFKRSQAWVHGDDDAWIDAWESEAEGLLTLCRRALKYSFWAKENCND